VALERPPKRFSKVRFCMFVTQQCTRSGTFHPSDSGYIRICLWIYHNDACFTNFLDILRSTDVSPEKCCLRHFLPCHAWQAPIFLVYVLISNEFAPLLIMATTKFEFLDDSKSMANAPPSYSASALSANSIQLQSCKLPSSTFSFLRMKQKRTTVLSCIRDIVCAPDFTPSSVAPIVNACAAALPAADFSELLQTPNIAGHTALYWAIVNNRREVFSAFAGFISKFSSVCSSDLRLACMATSDHALFTQLNLGIIDCKCTARPT